ncbi:glucosylceramidase [Flexibacter flexilis DSM 6793]|uniref:Glucosylceramidase n=1 Tax=Flexibacter flexilis DSM 6793 TaxID=927664 RepID=A0A1I1E6B8_9BACT|nr:glycoside hydrolase family 30 beta sandwich domain-containing protein [Flexibacter flexilis]SFB82681.1 glucosylceramidase [Flexibacter flexilis DSM 6793]
MKNVCLSALAIAAFLTSATACKKGGDSPTAVVEPTKTEPTVSVWVTTGNQSELLKKRSDIGFAKNLTGDFVTIDTAQHFQQIDGIGAAMTGSSAYLFSKKLTTAQRDAIMKELFTTNGIGISYLRLTIGASDFSLKDFSYNDLQEGQTDPNQQQFSMAEEQTDLLPMLKKVKAVSSEVKMMGSPWSPPAWMKTNNSFIQGEVKTEHYQAFANYLAKYVKTMEAEGLPLHAITIENEPQNRDAGYMSMIMSAEQQRDFIKNNLGPTFVNQNITTKILTWDHNWDKPEYPMTILQDPDAAQYVAGSAFHGYGGEPEAMSTVHNAYPEKGLYFTEISGGDWSPDFSGNLMWHMEKVLLGTMKNWSKSVIYWNLALDENHGPKNKGCGDCRGVITIPSSGNGKIIRNVEYYLLGHTAKFIRPGAYRVSSEGLTDSNIKYLAFVNPDGSKVVVALNKGNADKAVNFKSGARTFRYVLPANGVTTLTWK